MLCIHIHVCNSFTKGIGRLEVISILRENPPSFQFLCDFSLIFTIYIVDDTILINMHNSFISN